MTRRQMALIVVLNALIAALVSIAVVAGAVLLLRDKVAVLEPATRASTAVTVMAEQGQPATAVAAQPASETTPVIHTVQSGDTISALAVQYDVPAEDIVSANQIKNPDYLVAGTRLIIPVGGLPVATATNTLEPTATNTPIPYEPPSAQRTATAAAQAGATTTPLPTPLPITGELVIEITDVVKPGVIAQEGVTIKNRGSRLADMSGWTLNDAEGNSYTFPSFRLWAEGSVTIYTRSGQDGSPAASLYWSRSQAAWSAGEQVTLKDTAGKVIATTVVGQ